jgi:class 3 adenylate cyclase/tetratricopeptide (TPR) repeat protein
VIEGKKMKCPNCQTENPETKRFCRKCGTKLSSLCPQCGSEHLHGDEFCGDCGHDLTQPSPAIPKDLSFDEKIAKIQKYLPSGITEKILSQRDRIEGEKKQVTVLFCDMKGFTPLSESLGPEAMYAMMDEVYEILIHKVHEYEGTVNEMTGDGVMALFGAPIALEDAPQRAIRSAIAIHREMTRFNERMRQEKGEFPSVKMRVGIHTGPVVVGTLGNDLRVEFKAVGDTVNLASRMESLAEPGTTYISEDTFKITEGLFRVEALGEKEIKGKEKLLKVYQVIAPSSRRTRFDVSAERGLTPFVGRQRELELLLDGFERSREGRGQAISIISEAGIGKSRLLYEFRKSVTNEDVTFLEGRCLSYSRNVAYHPIVDILKANFEIQDNDTDQQIRQKVASFLKFIKVDESSTLPYLLELLSLKESGIEKIQMSPEAKKDRTLEALKRITLKGSEVRPLIMALEDLHWIDRSSEDALKGLLECISGSRVFLIFTYRPEFVYTWGSRSYHSQVTLNRLSNRESLAMLSHILGTQNIDRSLEEFILSKTEGIPFFIEEFIKSIIDLRVIEKIDSTYHLSKDLKTVSIPSTIYDVIMSKIDKLPEAARDVLRTGSIIEREFSHEIIRKATGLTEKALLSNLSTLTDAELLYERGVYPQSTYIFKHALTREVAYDSILAKRKKTLHEKIGNAIEELYKNSISEHYEILSEHYSTSENYLKSAEYSSLAGKKAEKAASLTDAITHFKKRVSSLEKLPLTDDVEKQIIDARTALSLYLFQIFYFVEAKEIIDPIIERAFRSGNKKRISQIHTILGTYSQWFEEDFPKAFEHLEIALRISTEINNIVAQFFANQWLGYAYSYCCEFEKAKHYFQKALDINISVNNIWGTSVVKCSLSQQVYNYQGMVKIGYEMSGDALRIAEESGDVYSKAVAYSLHGCSCYLKGHFEEAEKHLLKGVELNEKISFFMCNATAHLYLGNTYFAELEYEKAENHYEEAITILEQNKCLRSMNNLAKIRLALTRMIKNGAYIDLGSYYNFTVSNKLKVNDGCTRRHIGEILLHMNDQQTSNAQHWIEEAIDIDRRNGTRWDLGKDYVVYGRFFQRKGSQQKAKENLSKAIEIFVECGADGWVDKTEKELALIS